MKKRSRMVKGEINDGTNEVMHEQPDNSICLSPMLPNAKDMSQLKSIDASVRKNKIGKRQIISKNNIIRNPMPSKTPSEKNGAIPKVEKYKSLNMPCSVYMAPTRGVSLNNNLKSSAQAIKVNFSQNIGIPLVSPNAKRPK